MKSRRAYFFQLGGNLAEVVQKIFSKNISSSGIVHLFVNTEMLIALENVIENSIQLAAPRKYLNDECLAN